MLQQHIAQGNHRACFAGAGSHDQQSLAAVAGKGITGRFDSALLVITSGNTAVYHHIPQAGTHGLQVEQLFQIAFGINGSALAFWVNRVGNARFKAVCQKDDRAAVILFFQQIGIQFCLLATLCHIHTGALGFYHSQRAAIIAVKHIVGIAYLGFVGHTGQFYLVLPVLALGPACIGEHGIDVQLAGLVFGQVKRFGHIGLLLLGAAGGEFLFQCGVFCNKGSKVNIVFCVRLHGGNFGGLIQQSAVKVPCCIVFAVAICHKIKENVQVFKAEFGLFLGDFFAAVGSVIPHTADKIHAPPDVRADNIPEVLGVHQTDQRVLIGHDQRLIHRVHPFYGKLHRPAAVEDAGRRVDMQDALGGDGNRGKTLKLRGSGKNIEVGHKTSSTRYCIENFIFLQKQRLHSDFYSALSRVFHCKPFCQ